jgi:predicted enzyme related to lactoylglutathione lyase
VKTGGGQILNGPMQVPGGDWIIQGKDPQGAMFALVGQKT